MYKKHICIIYLFLINLKFLLISNPDKIKFFPKKSRFHKNSINYSPPQISQGKLYFWYKNGNY